MINFLYLEDEYYDRPIIGSYKNRIVRKVRKVLKRVHSLDSYVYVSEPIPRIARTHFINANIIKYRKLGFNKKGYK